MNPRQMTPGLLAGLLVAGSVWLLYWPARHFGFVYDDGVYLLRNPAVRQGLSWEGVRWALGTFHAQNWHPLTWISHMADVSLFGMNAGPHHLVNVFLHGLNALLLLLALQRMTGALLPSAVVAALFALHPLRVESVAWVAERKDVLSALAWCACLWLYAGHARRPHPLRLAAVCAVFALGAAAKPMLVTLPCVLLLLDFWPLGRAAPGPSAGRWRGSVPALLLEKLPLALIAAAVSAATYAAQSRGGAVSSLATYPFGVRLANAADSCAAYLGNILWPEGLAVIYPHPGPGLPLWRALVAAGALLLVTVTALRGARRRPYLAAGWLWYLGTLVPVIGVVQVGVQSLADRYTYLPGIGLLLPAVWGSAAIVRGSRRPRLAAAIAVPAILVALAAATRAQLSHWQDDARLFGRALAVTRGNWVAEYNYGSTLAESGRHEEAIPHYRNALRYKPDLADAHNNLGTSLDALGRREEAIASYREAARIKPRLTQARFNLAASLAALGRHGEAVEEFRALLRADPGDAEAHYRLGGSLFALGRPEDAAASLREALRLRPDYPEARAGLALALGGEGGVGRGDSHLRNGPRR